jgi:hypothetical protein
MQLKQKKYYHEKVINERISNPATQVNSEVVQKSDKPALPVLSISTSPFTCFSGCVAVPGIVGLA